MKRLLLSKLRLLLPALLLGAGLSSTLCPTARAQAVPEYAMKASYLYNFMIFAEWPNLDPQTPQEGLTLCVLGQDSFGEALSSLEGKNVNGRRLSVSRMNGLAGIKKCQLLFVTEQEAPNMQAILKHLADAPVLTVADTPVAAGAAILLSLDGKRLVFDVNIQRAKKVGIVLSSKVLQLARSTN
ncbi:MULTISPECIES: YfiR family protein [Roseateles]|uniref:YfiR family protein n=1 Tax=Roseateles albus TaxID=2987525 RepID=A0ABT5KBM9_9BURK|nr:MULTISPECIES: YfiR family protein [Roseateles]MCV2358786.1 YfiR family protein [Paucibacter sp. TC2R-5]MDC8771342.1 YfiR family protein [Roseateles albus]